MTDAIVTRLKTGSISRVYAKGDNASDLVVPYVIVSEAGNVGAGTLNLEQYLVTPHFGRGFSFELNRYLAEARGLLSGSVLTDANGVTAELETSGGVGPLIDSNDDGSISKELTFVAPGMVI